MLFDSSNKDKLVKSFWLFHMFMGKKMPIVTLI